MRSLFIRHYNFFDIACTHLIFQHVCLFYGCVAAKELLLVSGGFLLGAQTFFERLDTVSKFSCNFPDASGTEKQDHNH